MADSNLSVAILDIDDEIKKLDEEIRTLKRQKQKLIEEKEKVSSPLIMSSCFF